MTSLEMAGISITVLPVDDNLLAHLDAPCAHNAAWKAMPAARPTKSYTLPAPAFTQQINKSNMDPFHLSYFRIDEASQQLLKKAISSVVDAIRRSEDLLTKLDQETGDGDFGVTLSRGANSLHEKLQSSEIPLDNYIDTVYKIGVVLQKSMGGTSGVLYGVFFMRLAEVFSSFFASSPVYKTLSERYRVEVSQFPSLFVWATAFIEATNAIGQLGGAKLGTTFPFFPLCAIARSLFC